MVITAIYKMEKDQSESAHMQETQPKIGDLNRLYNPAGHKLNPLLPVTTISEYSYQYIYHIYDISYATKLHCSFATLKQF